LTARELLGSLVSEERRGRPGQAAMAAARRGPGEQIVVIYAAIAAGEARTALNLLDGLAASAEDATRRRVRACRAWAQQLDRNWYPGNVGAQLGPGARDGLTVVGEVFQGDDETMLVEACAAHGPASLLSLRDLIEGFVRASPKQAQIPLESALRGLERFKEIAVAANSPSTACWGMVAQADLLHRAGKFDDAQHQIERARQIYAVGQDAIGMACSYLVEGDWWAAPGSSPEALGLDLVTQVLASPFAAQQNSGRATEAYLQAESALGQVDAPRAVGALALRRAYLSYQAGEFSDQAECLAGAERAFTEAGEISSLHLVSVHRLAGELAGRDLRAVRRAAPPEWGKALGPLAEIASWGIERGSRSFCTGLGRILQCIAEQWEVRRDFDRAEFAYLMARPLVALSGAVPPWEVPMALAKLDERRNNQARSLARRLRVLSSQPPPPRAAQDPVAWMQQILLTMSLISVPSGRIGTSLVAVRLIEQGAERLRELLESVGTHESGEAVSLRNTRALAEELKERFARVSVADVMQQGSAKSFDAGSPAKIALDLAREQYARANPLASMLRAGHAERLGWESEADQWYRAALDQVADSGESNAWLGVLILGAWGKYAEARGLLDRVRKGCTLAEEMLPTLALRARDFTAARELFRDLDRSAAQGEPSWVDLLDRAEASLECKDSAGALGLARRAIDAFEDAIFDRLQRDSDRVAACDDVKAASLYLAAARAQLALGDQGAAFAIADRGHALALPHLVDDRLRPWHQAATEQSTAYQRYLSGLLSRGEGIEQLSDEVSKADLRLAELESGLEESERNAVRRSKLRPQEFSLADTQSRLPAGTCLIEYQLVGRDLAAWAVTRSSASGWYQRLPNRPLDGAVQRLLRSCAAGEPSIESQELAELLLNPFTRILEANERIIVVPFGPLHAVPFHVLPFRTKPLGATHVLSYLPAAVRLAEHTVDRALGAGGVLVVGDPAFDADAEPSLHRLAGADLEARIIGGLHQTRDVFRGEAAREEALRPLLGARSILHLAAHGRLDETAPNTSSIVLAGTDQLTVSDLIGLRIDADLAVLSACDTGRGAVSLGGDIVGLTRGLLAAGVKRSVVSLWPVDDVAACVTMVAFHSMLLRGNPPALALTAAQREIRALPGADLAARYRELGGDLVPGGVSRRRKSSAPRARVEMLRQLAPFPEADVDEGPGKAMEEMHGSLARLWAPFVLIGC
jgi:CHAT domain-containing protein